ncbi:response regulator transcription factor [Leifsonia shinshuensis]|uniref:Response regulator transcription factor n=2 Tax=Leifsonia shinshuensis TaxID=150026 RepID=A0A7G6YBG3_9MICO|nr:response regulator transcription factor [Leifsonia shinshuensis]
MKMYDSIPDPRGSIHRFATVEWNPAELTAREVQVIRYLTTGMTAFAIGSRLGISASTVRKHLEHAYGKLQCHDKVSAINRAREGGLIP